MVAKPVQQFRSVSPHRLQMVVLVWTDHVRTQLAYICTRASALLGGLEIYATLILTNADPIPVLTVVHASTEFSHTRVCAPLGTVVLVLTSTLMSEAYLLSLLRSLIQR